MLLKVGRTIKRLLHQFRLVMMRIWTKMSRYSEEDNLRDIQKDQQYLVKRQAQLNNLSSSSPDNLHCLYGDHGAPWDPKHPGPPGAEHTPLLGLQANWFCGSEPPVLHQLLHTCDPQPHSNTTQRVKIPIPGSSNLEGFLRYLLEGEQNNLEYFSPSAL